MDLVHRISVFGVPADRSGLRVDGRKVQTHSGGNMESINGFKYIIRTGSGTFPAPDFDQWEEIGGRPVKNQDPPGAVERGIVFSVPGDERHEGVS